MGLRIGFGLPGPFSWSTSLTPRVSRSRRRSPARAPRPARSCSHCAKEARPSAGHDTIESPLGGTAIILGVLVGIVTGFIGGLAWFFIWTVVGIALGTLIAYFELQSKTTASGDPTSPARYSDRR